MADVLRLRDFNKMQNLPFNPPDDGFVYSSSEIEIEARRRDRYEQARVAQYVNFNYAEFQKRAA